MTNQIDVLGYKVFCGEPDQIGVFDQGIINTINPHSYIVAKKDPLFREALKASAILLPDGIGVCYAARLFRKAEIRRISGYDLFIHLMSGLNAHKGSCFFFGASEKTLALIRNRLAVDYPHVRAQTLSPPFKDSFSPQENMEFTNIINAARPDILFVGMTAPKQEKWVGANRDALKVGTIASIGAVFDFYADVVPRPGAFYIDNNLEWLGRLLKEPRRMYKRNFYSTPLFIMDCIKQKFFS